jgi:hypothetical protein
LSARNSVARVRLSRADCFVGGFAVAAIVLHDFAHISEGRWYDVFWVCNLAALLVGPGVLLRSPSLSIAALTWIVPGTIVWLLDALLAGSNLLPTSYGVHLGGSLAAAYGVWRAGYATKSFWLTASLPMGAMFFSRLVLPPEHNVNAAHAVPKGWGFLGESSWSFFVVSTLISLALVGLGLLAARGIARLGPSKGQGRGAVASSATLGS